MPDYFTKDEYKRLSPHTSLSDNTPQDDRRSVAIAMLNEWAILDREVYTRTMRGCRPETIAKRDRIQEEILQLIGVD